MNNLSEHFSKLADLQYFDYKAFQSNEIVSKEVCGFVLSLALIYNDIKNIGFLIELLRTTKPKGSFVERKDWGEYNGINNFLEKLTMGILHELFNLIKDNKRILEDKFFKQIINSIRKDAKIAWQVLVDTSFEKYGNNKLAKDLMLVRNKISFHYDPKAIKQGYDYFFNDKKKWIRHIYHLEKICLNRDSTSQMQPEKAISNTYPTPMIQVFCLHQ